MLKKSLKQEKNNGKCKKTGGEFMLLIKKALKQNEAKRTVS